MDTRNGGRSSLPPRRRSRRARHARKRASWLERLRPALSWGLRRAAGPAGASGTAGAIRRELAVVLHRGLARGGRVVAAVFGIVVVLFSVYLFQAGFLVPSSAGFPPPAARTGGAPGEATETGAGAGPEIEPGPEAGPEIEGGAVAGSETEPGAESPAAAEPPPAGPTVAAPGSGSSPPGRQPASAPETSAPGTGPVLEAEGPSGSGGAEVGPRSLGECLEALAPPATGSVVRPWGVYYYSSSFADWRYHAGVDIALAEGEAVRAALAGLVTAVSSSSREAWRVELSHGFGLVTVYSHLGSVVVQEGDEVGTGSVLGAAGPPGAAEADLGPHLHFEIRVETKAIDPGPYLGS